MGKNSGEEQENLIMAVLRSGDKEQNGGGREGE
jgi:hypothetical protein